FIPATNQQPYNLSGLCAGSNLYVVYIDLSGCTSWTSGGTLSNSPSGPRFFQITSTSCNSSSSPIQSYNDSWSSNSNGNYASYESGSAVYTNNGCSAPVIMPVETKYLNVYKKGKTVELLWATASETNNSHFNIERSADTRNFETIGEIKGAGNSSKEISYAFTDERPLPGINYYRIKQTDYDGQYSYSEIKSVRHKGISNVSITPRTTDGRLDINTELEDYTIGIYNAAGQEVKKMTGMSLDQSISLETLHAGVYFVKINSRSESETVRIVKI
ncbi:MAG: T9SS type A sorting domain-containing protein, partial [Saprospiraceae bacterium]